MQYRRYLVKNVTTGAKRTVLVPLDSNNSVNDYLKKGEKVISVVGKVDKNA